jgi:hypothetical protein
MRLQASESCWTLIALLPRNGKRSIADARIAGHACQFSTGLDAPPGDVVQARMTCEIDRLVSRPVGSLVAFFQPPVSSGPILIEGYGGFGSALHDGMALFLTSVFA